jgi:hypothetical protein
MTVTKFPITPHPLVAEIYLIEEDGLKLLCARMENTLRGHPSWHEYPWLEHSWRYVGDKELIRIAELLFAPLIYDSFAPLGFVEGRTTYESNSISISG